MQSLLIYISLLTILAFLVMGMDKWKAIQRRRRVAEKHLILLACAGGFIGVLTAMLVFRHKVRKPLFTVLVPFIAIIETSILFTLII